ncbi:hypothetical protein KPH14_008110 [Odynerus spinipes]|uniref:Meiosis-specific nuclear structural protein 1 n=1 Tax=Odynerus spinipes TaxID=1348599 RepID=A0AAD9RK96_9HYME|nr:hypothetical protein KPH14_008110 [Odynerus spinipes]
MESDRRLDGKRVFVGSKLRNRESTDKLVELEAELRRAYWKKSLSAQLAEKEIEANLKAAEEAIRSRVALESKDNEEEEDRRRRRKRIEEMRELVARELAEKAEREERERKARREEGLREREVLEEAERRLEELENSRTLERRLELAEGSAKERRIVAELREIRLAKEREEERRLERDGERYSREIERRANEARSCAIRLAERRERVLSGLLAMILAENGRKREREALLEELVLGEIERERTIAEWKERCARARMPKELANDLAEQIALTELCKASFLQRDKEFAEETMRKLAEDEKILRLTAEARRRALSRYREDLERMIEERRKIRDEEVRRIEREWEEERRLDELRVESVARERESLLLEHASNVGGFLNERLLSENERAILNSIISKEKRKDVRGTLGDSSSA